jgi:hypothetical protein
MKKKKGKKIQSHAEWREEHREQFERTDRMYEEAQKRWAREAEEREAARKAAEEQDAA